VFAVREYEKKKKTIEELVVKKILCNKCGMDTHSMKENSLSVGLKEMKIDFGYEYSFDGQSWSFDLCEICFKDFVKTLKYAPTGFGRKKGYEEYDGGEEISQEGFEDWKKNN
jgi:hypothetical protein